MRIGLWGGSFNPPTLAHKAMADEAFKWLKLDQLWWVVAPHNPLKDIKTLAPFAHRLKMVDLILSPHSKMLASDIEQQLQSSITLNTVRHVRKQHPEDALFLLMGMDNWQTLHLWDDYAELLQYVSIAVFNRPGYDGFDTAPVTTQLQSHKVTSPDDMKNKGTWCILDNQQHDVAATTIRKQIAAGQTPDALDSQIRDYIHREGLYASVQ